MKQKLKPFIKLIALCVVLALSSCEKDLYDETLSSQKRLLMKEVSLKDFSVKTNSKLMKVVDELNLRKLKTSGKIVYDSIKNFWYDDEKGIYIENGFIHSYTFNVERQNSDGKIEKIVFQSDGNDGYKTLLVKYDFTKEELAQMSEAQLMLEEVVVTDISTSKCAGDVDLIVICNYEYAQTTVTDEGYPPCDQPGVPHENGEVCHTHTEWVTTGYSCTYDIHSDGCGGDEFSGGHEDGESPSNPEEGSGGVITTPIPCLFCSEPDVMQKKPCEVLNEILKTPTSVPSSPNGVLSIKEAILDLKNRAPMISDHEEGYNFVYSASTYEMVAYPAEQLGTNMVKYNLNPQVFGGAHFHQDGLQPMFSHDDLATLSQFIEHFNVPGASNNVNLPMPMHILVNDYGAVYAIMAENAQAFSTLIRDIYHDSSKRRKFKKQLEKSYANYFWPSLNQWRGTQNDYELTLMKFIKGLNNGNGNGDLGLKLYKAKADLTNWSELTLVPSLTTIDDYTVKPIDCK